MVRPIDLVGNLTPGSTQPGLTQNYCVFGGSDDTKIAAVITAIGEGEAHIFGTSAGWATTSASQV
ncbi:MAG: hypothetical protein IPN93_09245 [Bacteroidetes bacterium]|nr:hypothetical protein [Bacteroidota bacterium]